MIRSSALTATLVDTVIHGVVNPLIDGVNIFAKVFRIVSDPFVFLINEVVELSTTYRHVNPKRMEESLKEQTYSSI